MLHRIVRLSACVCLAMLVSGCLGLPFGGKKDKVPKPKIVGFPKGNFSDGTPREPRLVGRIAMVNAQGKFVLVHCDAWSAPEEGTALKCISGDTETGIVNVNAERRGSYVTADIVTGTPNRGDQVYQ